MRSYNRKNNEARPYSFETGFTKNANGSVLVRCGETVVLCTANVEEKVPPWLADKGVGWVTAEYAMLPGSTSERVSRKSTGRSKEIQRLIGRSLRASIDEKLLAGYTISIDCDVLQADGGTRTASICGGWVAMSLAIKEAGINTDAVKSVCSAISVGILDDEILVDLDYREDSSADVDMNLVCCDGGFVEIQGTGEKTTFNQEQLLEIIKDGQAAIDLINELQQKAVSGS
jgi:ribonuclease PH